MEDHRIVELLFERSESALTELSQKYSGLYRAMIREALNDETMIDECANDLLLAVWNSIPPHRPDNLSAYLCRIARRIGIDRLRYCTSQKRNAGYTVMLSELDDCLPAEEPTDDIGEQGEGIRAVLSDFIRSLDPETEVLFIRRYVYSESVASLAKRFGKSENHIAVKLYRARIKLKKLLKKEGIKV